jgi:transposase
VQRFHGSKAAVSQAGLAPRVANSADRQRHGRITKRGSPELRWILCQMSARRLGRDEMVRPWAAPRLRRMHANKVRVELARRRSIGIYPMLRTGEGFCLQRGLAP